MSLLDYFISPHKRALIGMIFGVALLIATLVFAYNLFTTGWIW